MFQIWKGSGFCSVQLSNLIWNPALWYRAPDTSHWATLYSPLYQSVLKRRTWHSWESAVLTGPDRSSICNDSRAKIFIRQRCPKILPGNAQIPINTAAPFLSNRSGRHTRERRNWAAALRVGGGLGGEDRCARSAPWLSRPQTLIPGQCGLSIPFSGHQGAGL